MAEDTTSLVEPPIAAFDVGQDASLALIRSRIRNTLVRPDIVLPTDVMRTILTHVNQCSAGIQQTLEKNGYDIDVIESFLDGFFGPLRLSNDALFTTGKEITSALKEERARVGQAMAHYILYAASKQASPEFTAMMHESVSLMEHIASSRLGDLSDFGALWKGIKSQTIIMQALIKLGYDVYQPSYTVTDAVLEDPTGPANEILHWDIKAGVDCIAVIPGSNIPLLVDTKGRNSNRIHGQHYTQAIPSVYQVDSKLTPSLRSFLQSIKLDPATGQHIHIVIPTSTTVIPPFEPDKDNPRNALRQFITLPLYHKEIIQTELDKITSNQQNTIHSEQVA